VKGQAGTRRGACFSLPILMLAAAAQAQQAPMVIRAETRTVLVDAVVTDRSGKSIHDLTAKDFHLWEDNKEQSIQNATFVADPAANPATQTSYLVLFFDNSTLDYAAQSRARDAAVQFLEANAGPNRMVAIANYTGTLSIAQNFTSDVDRLKRVAALEQGATTAVSLGATGYGGTTTGRAAVSAGFGGEGLLLALRTLAGNLSSVPGRKIVVLFSAGYPYTPNLGATLDSTVRFCNRADASIYPVDVGGLNSNVSVLPGTQLQNRGRGARDATQASDITEAEQRVLDLLAKRTGGFLLANANSPVAGLLNIGKEQTEYYLLSYSAPESREGSCHALRVKTDRTGAAVRARASYCNVKAVDLLAGRPVEKSLEDRLSDDTKGNAGASMQLPFFYVSPGKARLHVAMEIPVETVPFEKVKGKLHAAMDIVGIAYDPGGAVSARFSDTVNLDFTDPKEVAAFHKQPLHYEKQFFVAPGKYDLKVAYTFGGENFGKLAAPVEIASYDGKQFAMSGLALSKEVRPVLDKSSMQDDELLEGLTPLIFHGLRIVPAGSHQFRNTDALAIYCEVYDPLLGKENAPPVQVLTKVVDSKTGEVKSTGTAKADTRNDASVAAGGAAMPVAVKVKLDGLPAGLYRVELEAMDSAGAGMARAIDFEIR
jgi:VWFA-related protein